MPRPIRIPHSTCLLALLVLLISPSGGLRADEAFDDAVSQLHVEAAHVPGDAPAAGQMLLEFKRQMALLETRVRGRLETAGALQTQAGATAAEVRDYKRMILESGRAVGVRLARELRDPAMAFMVAAANRGRPKDARIQLAAGTSPSEGGYRGGWGDIDLQGRPTAVDAFKKVFAASGVAEQQAHMGGYVSYEEIDVTLHRLAAPLGAAGSGAHRDQIGADAATKETYVSAAMKDGQPGRRAVLVHDHMKKAYKGSTLAPDQLLRSREALQSFAKGTLKTLDAAGLPSRDLGRILAAAGYPGSVQDFRAKLKALKSEGYAIAPGEIGLDVDTIRAFQQASLEAMSACDQRMWGSAQQEMARMRGRIQELRARGTPADLELATSLAADVLDSETRLNEVFKANKERFGFLAERAKVQAVLMQPRAERIRFVTYMSEARLGRGICVTLLLEQARRDPEAARRLLEELPPHVRERLRREQGFGEFEAQLARTADPFWKREVELPALVAKWKGVIASVNASLSADIQRCAAARGFSQGMRVWGKIGEAEAYWQAWERGGPEELIVEIIRRRVPYATTVEYAMLGNYWMAGWDVVITMLPPVGLLQAAATIGMSLGRYTVDFVLQAEQLAYEEELYRTALFELEGVTSLEDAKLGVWKLVQVAPEGRVTTRDDLFAGKIVLAYATQRMVEEADPVLRQIHEMERHPDVGPRLYERYGEQYALRRARVMQWWGRQTIERLEHRKRVQDAWVRGSLPALYAELLRVTADLEIRAEVERAMDGEIGQGLLDPLKQWVQDALFRQSYVQGTKQPTLREEQAAEAVVRHLMAYRRVLEVRARVERHVGLEGARDAGLRLLTGADLLTADPARDVRRAENWQSRGLAHVTRATLELETIRARYLDCAGSMGAYDTDAATRLARHRAWLDAWKDVLLLAGADPARAGRATQAVARRTFHTEAVAALLSAYEQHYAQAVAGALRFHVRERAGGVLTDRTIPRLRVAVQHEGGAAAAAPAMGGGVHILARVPLGRWSWIAVAPGYTAASGEPRATGTVLLTPEAPAKEVEIELQAVPDLLRLEFLDDRGRPVPDVTGTVADGSGAEGAIQGSADGLAYVTQIYRGSWTVRAQAPGYAPTQSAPILVDPAEGAKTTPQPVPIVLTPYHATLALRVLDARELPVEDADVRLETRRGRTGPEGEVRFEDLRPVHQGRLSIVKAGYAPMRQRLDLLASQEGEVFERKIVLAGGVTLRVQVVDATTGRGVAGARVRVSSADEHAAPETDAQGLARVPHLPPDFVYVAAEASGYVPAPSREIDLRKAVDGAEVSCRIEVRAGMTLRVLVQRPDGTLIPGARVHVDDGPARFAPTGTAELAPVVAGEHEIRALAEGWSEGRHPYAARPEVQARDVLALTLQPGATMRARVLDETGGLYRAAATTLELRREGAVVSRAPGPESLCANLEPGAYTLTAQTPGAPAVTSEAVVLAPAPASASVFVRLPSPGLLRVWVEALRAGASVPAPDATITVEGPGGVRSDRGTLGLFPGLPAGAHTVRASAPGFRDGQQTVTLPVPEPGRVTDVRLRLEAGESVGGGEGPKDVPADLGFDELLARIALPAGTSWRIGSPGRQAAADATETSAPAAAGGKPAVRTLSIRVMRVDGDPDFDAWWAVKTQPASQEELDRPYVAERERILRDLEAYLTKDVGTTTTEHVGKGESGGGTYTTMTASGIYERASLPRFGGTSVHQVVTGFVVPCSEQHHRTVSEVRIEVAGEMQDGLRTTTTLEKAALGEVPVHQRHAVYVRCGAFYIEASCEVQTHVQWESVPLREPAFPSVRSRFVVNVKRADLDGTHEAALGAILGLAGR